MSFDGVLSSGGVQKHGSSSHVNQGNPGTYAMPFAVTYDATGAESAAYQAWSATPTYPANTYVLGSDSKLYRAVISNAGNNPVGDDGTHWVRVSVPAGGTAGGQVPIWDNTAKEYVAGSVSGTIANGTTTNSTLRWNGSGWVESTFVKNSDAQLTVNSPTSPISGVPLVIKVAGSGTQPNGLMVQDETATDPTSISVYNSASGVGFQFGLSGGTDGFMPGTSQGDGVLRLQKDGKRIWIGSKLNPADTTGTAIMALDQTGVVIGSTATPGAKLDVSAGSGVGLNVTGAASQKALTISGNNAPLIDVTNASQNCMVLTSSTALSSSSGASINIASNAAATQAGWRYGILNFSKNVSGTITAVGGIDVFSEEDNTTNIGSKMRLRVGGLGTGAQRTSVEVRANGDVSLNASGSEATTSATGGFAFLPTVVGTPTGTPANSYLGAVPLVVDRQGNRIFAYGSSWVDLATRVPVTLTDGATINTDASLAKHFRVTLGGNRTMAAPTNPTDGQRILYEIIQDATGSRTLTWNAAFAFGTDVTTPTLTTTASKRDFVGFAYNASASKWYCLAVARGY